MKELKRSEDIKKYLKSSKPVAIFFYMDGCPHCEAMKPIWNQLENENPSIEFVEIESANVPSDLGIVGYPKFMKIEGGKQVGNADGEMTKEELKATLLKSGGRRRRNRSRRLRRTRRKTLHRTTRRNIPF